MKRFNLFQLLHKGLKASLYQVSLQLQQSDFSNEKDAEANLEKLFEVILLFHNQAEGEKKFLLPLLSEFEPSVVATLQISYSRSEELSQQIYKLAEKFSANSCPSQKCKWSTRISNAFLAFTLYNLQHLTEKEHTVNRILWRYYSDVELMHLAGKMEGDRAPWLADFYAGWMVRGLNNKELIEWLSAVRITMPPLVYRTLSQKMQKDFPRSRFHIINQSLAEAIRVFAN